MLFMVSLIQTKYKTYRLYLKKTNDESMLASLLGGSKNIQRTQKNVDRLKRESYFG
jgi:hypothetical protein